MARQSKEVTIGLCTYKVTQLGGRKAARLAARIVKMLAAGASKSVSVTEAISDLASQVKAGKKDQDPEISKLLMGLFSVLSELDPDLLEETMMALAEFTSVNLGNGLEPQLDAVFDEHFAGNLGAMGKWFVFAFEVNFANFLREAVVPYLFTPPTKTTAPTE